MSFLLLQHLLKEVAAASSTSTSRDLQPALDESATASRGMEVCRTSARSECTSCSRPSGAKRVVLRRLRAADGPRHRAARHMSQDSRGALARIPAAGEARRDGEKGHAGRPTHEPIPVRVWEEAEFWIALSWKIDPDGSMGIRQTFNRRTSPTRRSRSTSTTAWIFENSVPGLPEAAATESLARLQ